MSKSLVMKIITAGEGGVGKTTLLYRYKEGRFLEDTSMTSGVEFSLKTLLIDKYKMDLQIWDFGGQDRFRYMLPNYVVGALGALFMVDLSRIMTLDNIEEWVNLIRKNNPRLPIILVGTKNDLVEEIQIDDDYAMEFKNKYEIFDFIKTSSKSGENVEKCFEKLARKIIELNTA